MRRRVQIKERRYIGDRDWVYKFSPEARLHSEDKHTLKVVVNGNALEPDRYLCSEMGADVEALQIPGEARRLAIAGERQLDGTSAFETVLIEYVSRES